MRRLLPLTVILATVLAACAAAHADAPLRLRVLTYNIQHGAGMDNKIDLPRIAEVIKRAQPDAVALQEVDNKTARSKGVDQAAELGRLTGMHAAFGKAMDLQGGQYGEAVLSRFPLAKIENHPLPHTAGREPRAALAVQITPADDRSTIMFIGTHLDHQGDALRLKQAEEINKLVANDDMPAVLAGDFNAEPDSPPIKAILQRWTDATADAPQKTWPADKPTEKLDYVFFRPAGAWRVVEKRVIEETAASDHRPLLVVLEYVFPKDR